MLYSRSNPFVRASFLAALLAIAGASQGALVLTIAPDVVAVDNPGTAVFNASLENTGPDELFLNFDDYSFSYPGLLLDDSDFFLNTPLSMVAGEKWSGSLFRIEVSDEASAGSYDGIFSILGGPSSSDFDVIASDPFTLIVRPVPEPASLAALGIGALGILRGRKKA